MWGAFALCLVYWVKPKSINSDSYVYECPPEMSLFSSDLLIGSFSFILSWAWEDRKYLLFNQPSWMESLVASATLDSKCLGTLTSDPAPELSEIHVLLDSTDITTVQPEGSGCLTSSALIHPDSGRMTWTSWGVVLQCDSFQTLPTARGKGSAG